MRGFPEDDRSSKTLKEVIRKYLERVANINNLGDVLRQVRLHSKPAAMKFEDLDKAHRWRLPEQGAGKLNRSWSNRSSNSSLSRIRGNTRLNMKRLNRTFISCRCSSTVVMQSIGATAPLLKYSRVREIKTRRGMQRTVAWNWDTSRRHESACPCLGSVGTTKGTVSRVTRAKTVAVTTVTGRMRGAVGATTINMEEDVNVLVTTAGVADTIAIGQGVIDTVSVAKVIAEMRRGSAKMAILIICPVNNR